MGVHPGRGDLALARFESTPDGNQAAFGAVGRVCAGESTWYCSYGKRNDYEPDIIFFGPVKAATIDPDTLKFPIPDLIVEVLSPSTEKRDRGIKFQDYALHGVAEYWIIDPVAEAVELYRLQGDAYPATAPQTDGLLSSDVVPGFEIPVRAIFDEAENARVMRQIWVAE